MADYDESVFINCPFDEEYRPLFQALVFTVHDRGYLARCALEVPGSGHVRIQKIQRIIEECCYGLHDISRTELDRETALPRFNMPLELGLFLGAQRYGDERQSRRRCKVLDLERYRFQKYISDIAGQDISPHDGRPEKAIQAVRDWLRDWEPEVQIPGPKTISRRFARFREELPLVCQTAKVEEDELTFVDFRNTVMRWLGFNPW
jgi:hypothetical protein